MTQFFTSPVDKSLGSTGTWVDIDLSDDIPIGATGAIFQVHKLGIEKLFGLRCKGSTDEHYHMVPSAAHVFVIIKVDSNRKCQGKIEDTTIDFHLVGYTESDITLSTNSVDKSQSTTNTWTDLDLSTELPAGSVAAIFEIINNAAADSRFGFRNNGSGDNLPRDLRSGSHAWFVVGVDSARKCEYQIESADVDFYLHGYLTQGEATINGIDRSLSTYNTYVEIDESANAPGGATGIFAEAHAYSGYKFAARKIGSTHDIFRENDEHQGFFVGLDNNYKWEGKIESSALDFLVLGYFVRGQPIQIRDHIHLPNVRKHENLPKMRLR